MRLNVAVVMILTGALTACAGSVPPGCAALPGGGHYCLQSSRAVAPFDAVQAVSTELNGQRHTLIATVEADGTGLRLAGLTPFGQKLLAAAYDNEQVQTEAAPGIDRRLDPVLLLALLQLALWPEREAAAGLAPSLQLVSEDNRRRVCEQGRTLLTIDREGTTPPYRRLTIALPAAGLSLTVETLQAETR